MKAFKLLLLFSFTLLLFFGNTLQAQKNQTSKSTYLIIQKNNGDEKMVKDFDDLENILIDFEVEEKDVKQIETFITERSHRSTKPFLGVYSEKNHDGAGIIITGTVNNSAAQKAGIQKRDIITTINGTSLNSVEDLRQELAKHKVGDAIQVGYLRNNVAAQMPVTLGAKQRNRHHSYSYNSHAREERDPCKVFIGLSNGSGFNDKGVKIKGIFKNTPAEEMQLQRGDYVTEVDGIAVFSYRDILRERNKHSPGDKFSITYERNGVEQEVDGVFKSCDQATVKEEVKIEVEETQPVVEIPAVEVDNTLKVEGLEAYPNPTYGDLNLNFKAEAQPTNVRIIDVQGRVIYEETLNNFDGDYKKLIDLSNGTPGVLSINITQKGKAFTKNIILLARA